MGRRGIVDLRIWRQGNLIAANAPQTPYLVVSEPLPAGAAVTEDSFTGPFERFELSPGAITFYLGNKPEHARITYEVHGYVAGQYRTAPTLVRDAFRPDQIAVAEPRPLAVLAAGAASGDAYRLTPQELYELGRRLFEKGDLAAAAKHLNDLFNQWNLQPEPYKQTVRTLFGILRLRTRVPVSRIPHPPHFQTDERLDWSARFEDAAGLLTGRSCRVADDGEEDGRNALKISDSETYFFVRLTHSNLAHQLCAP